MWYTPLRSHPRDGCPGVCRIFAATGFPLLLMQTDSMYRSVERWSRPHLSGSIGLRSQTFFFFFCFCSSCFCSCIFLLLEFLRVDLDAPHGAEHHSRALDLNA